MNLIEQIKAKCISDIESAEKNLGYAYEAKARMSIRAYDEMRISLNVRIAVLNEVLDFIKKGE